MSGNISYLHFILPWPFSLYSVTRRTTPRDFKSNVEHSEMLNEKSLKKSYAFLLFSYYFLYVLNPFIHLRPSINNVERQGRWIEMLKYTFLRDLTPLDIINSTTCTADHLLVVSMISNLAYLREAFLVARPLRGGRAMAWQLFLRLP